MYISQFSSSSILILLALSSIPNRRSLNKVCSCLFYTKDTTILNRVEKSRTFLSAHVFSLPSLLPPPLIAVSINLSFLAALFSFPHMLTHSLSPNILFLLLHCTCIAALLPGPFFWGIGSEESHPPEQSTCRKKGKEERKEDRQPLIIACSCPGRRDGWRTYST